MKAIQHKGQITSIIAKVDGSVGYRINTPELANNEKAAIFDLQNKNVEVLISPFDEPEPELIKVDKDIETKSQAQRIRSVLFILFNQNPEGLENFETYYHAKTEKYIESLKARIEE